MTDRVDFYVLNSQSAQRRCGIACRLTAKAFLQDLSIVVWSADAEGAKLYDDMLWTFDDRSFVPHQLSGRDEPLDSATPVNVVLELDRVERADLLINLTNRFPTGLERFSRIAEIVDAEPECRRLGRERFKTYRDHKLVLETHQLSDAADI
jgi:DNA polymerase III subunit chi